jgi:iron complex outermembrane recepter protein
MPPRESVAVFRDAPARGEAGSPPLPAAHCRTNTREPAAARPSDPMRCAPRSARILGLQLVSTFRTAWVLALLCVRVVALAYGEETASSPAVDAGPGTALQELIVTARKRTENIETTPVAITAISSEEMQTEQVRTVSDVARLTPSLSFANVLYDPFGTLVVLRGEAATDNLLETEPPVGIYVDGVYQGATLGTNISSLLDVSQIEVLKGPQGTLYGRNTTGGAINITTNLPDYSGVSGDVHVREANYSTRQADGVINVPLSSDVLAARLGVEYVDQGGYALDIANDRRLGNAITTTVHGVLRIDPSSRVNIVLRGDYTTGQTNGGLEKMVYLEQGSAANIEGSIELASAGKLINPMFSRNFLTVLPSVLSGKGTPAQLATFGEGIGAGYAGILASIPPNPYQTALNPGTFAQLDTYSTSLTANFKLGDELSLKSISAFLHQNRNYAVDGSATLFDIFVSTFPSNRDAELTNNDQFTQELDLSGVALHDLLHYLLGFYFLHSDGEDRGRAVLLPALNPDTPEIISAGVSDQSTAVFAQGTYMILPGLNLTAGARGTWETKELTSQNSTGEGPTYSCSVAIAAGAPCVGKYSNSYSNLSYTASLDYQLNKETLVYVRSGSGFKAGGQNERINPSNGAYANFAPEKVVDYEIGLKIQALADRLRFNADYYHSNYTNIQQTEIVSLPGGGVTTIIANSGKAHIDGIELDGELLPIRELLLRAGASWMMPKYDTPVPAYSSGRLQEAPPFQGYVSATLMLPTPAGNAKLNANYSWQGLTDFQPADHDSFTSAPYSWQRTYGLLGARLSFEFSRTRTEIAAYGTNLTDRYHIVGAVDLTAAGLGYVVNLIGPPRMYGIELTQQF